MSAIEYMNLEDAVINCSQTPYKLYLHNLTSMDNSKWLIFEPIR